MKRARPENYKPWKKEPQYLFDAPEHRQRPELTAAQFGITSSSIVAPAPAPAPKRSWSYDEKGQGGLFNMSRGRRNRSGGRIAIEYGTKAVDGGWRPVVWENGREQVIWSRRPYDERSALAVSLHMAEEQARKYVGDWVVTVRRRR